MKATPEEVDELVVDILEWWNSRAPLEQFGEVNTSVARWRLGPFHIRVRTLYTVDRYRRGLQEDPDENPRGLERAARIVRAYLERPA